MQKGFKILLAILLLAALGSVTVLCVHCSMLPEASTKYYAEKAEQEAQSDNSAEAELMRLLLGGGAAAAEPEETKEFSPVFNRYGLLLALSALAGLLIFFSRNEKNTAHFAAALLAAAFGLLGARLFYAAANSKFYVLDIGVPMAMLRIWEGGLSLSGALVGAALGCCLGARLGKISAAQMLGQMAPGLMLFAAGARLAEMAVNAGFGMEMESSLWLLTREAGDGWRLNTALIMGIFDLLIMLLLFKMKEKQPGDRFWTGAFLYGSIHVLLESLRRDGHMQLGFVHVEQLFALLIALAALLVFAFRGKKVWLALLSTVILAGAVIGLEFALDRSNIHDGLLYIIYALLLIGYGRMGIYIAGQEKKMFRKERAIRA